MNANMIRISKGMGAALLLATLAACGSGLGEGTASSSSSSSGSSGGGNNNTPPGIPNNIVFIAPSSGNTVIALQGTGGKTNAEVTFEVDDASNTGVAGIPVTFSLIPSTGDASLTTTTGTTGTDGRASTFVVSGNVHTSVTVHAVISTAAGVKTADSNALTITTGIPTEGNFGLAITKLTANNADDTLGITDTVTVQLSDRFSNPAPDGTAVSFYANIGQITGQCFTAGGSCTATWTSSGLPAIADTYHELGQAEILAYAVGEESFTDVDGDGTFDNSDKFTIATASSDSFAIPLKPSADDIGEVYLDGAGISHPPAYLAGDFFFDFNKDGVRNGPDGKFYGFNCKGTATVPCGSKSTIGIGKQICINMSTSGASIALSPGAPGSLSSSDVLTVGGGNTITFAVSDTNGHALASGTTVTLQQAGITGAITVSSPTNLPFAYADEGCGPFVEFFTVTITLVNPPPVGVSVGGTLQLKVVTPAPGGAETDSQVITLQ